MSPEITIVLAILISVIVLLVTEWMPLEVVALLVLGTLAISGIVSPLDALAGFSNPAVVTIWAVFILSGGLTRTGIANILGRQLLKVAGRKPSLLVVTIMGIAGGLSAFMNNVAVAALMLPVVMDIARKTDCSPAALLMPLAYGSLLGGLTTMIGTPPNILVSEALRENGLTPFKLFDFTPLGLLVMVSGIAFVTLIGTRMLPKHNRKMDTSGTHRDFRQQYELQKRLFQINIPPTSALVGKTLAKSRLGSGFGLNVVGIIREGNTLLAPEVTQAIQAEDMLVVEGRLDRIQEMNHWSQLTLETDPVDFDIFFTQGMQVAELTIRPASPYVDQTLSDIGFRNRFGLTVLAIGRNGYQMNEDLKSQSLKANDTLVVYGPAMEIAAFQHHTDFLPPRPLDRSGLHRKYPMNNRIGRLRIPENSNLIGLSLNESRLGDTVDLQILCIVRQNGLTLVPKSGDRFETLDQLIVSGDFDMISVLLSKGIESIFIQDYSFHPDPAMLEDDHVGIVEVIFSPHSVLSGLTLRQINFREKYGLNVLAIWRKGRPYSSGLRDMALEFGDALLLYGQWKKLTVLGKEPDFLVLTETAQESPREDKAKIALTIMGAVLLPVIMGWVPIYIAVVMGAAFMVLTKCLTMEEAYRYIEWKAVFLIAGMLPLGMALDKSGAARLLAEGVVSLLGPFGPYAVLFGILVITFLATSIIPTSALVVLMVPIALKTSASLGISPYALMMGIAMAASSSFTSPISHPANVLVMGPGGYRFIDYVKVGAPLTLVILIVLMLALPILWPL
ncbi:SLC13 family permease [Desulfobacula sp.]|uniref:SLC13 family permease n=1 Tax=Desulfobacula sp. TaxID=2593537 RepID=UPI0026063E7E|nr:SLC13 family permease [Desulfobacula sp.]